MNGDKTEIKDNDFNTIIEDNIGNSHSRDEERNSSSNNQERDNSSDDDLEFRDYNTNEKNKRNGPLLDFNQLEASVRTEEVEHDIEESDWWSKEGLSYEEAKEFDSQFYIRRINNSNEGINKKWYNKWLSSTWARMIWTTITLLGLQFTWSLELSYGTPYLLSLGLSKSMMSLVWLAGPLSGLIMQPLIGVISDKCESPLGRRRPFLIVGTVFVLFALISIGWTQEFVDFLNGPSSATKYIAVLAFYILDFAVNTIQAAARALVVDVLPAKFQETGNAWAGRMIGVGNVIGYFMGYLDLVTLFPGLGDKQLKILSFFACLLLTFMVGLTCFMVREIQYSKPNLIEPPINEAIERNNTHEFTPIFQAIKDIFINIKSLPQPIWRLCVVQFFSWIGWFPFLFYSTTWVAEFMNNNIAINNNQLEDEVGNKTRVGSKAFVIYSIVSLVSSFVLPVFCSSSINNNNNSKLKNIIQYFPTLPQFFTLSLVLFGILMLSTFFINSVIGATLIIALCGISWSVSMWAPFALIGEFVHQKGSISQNSEYLPLQDIVTQTNNNNNQIHQINDNNNNNNVTNNDSNLTNPQPEAGMILGIHNIFIVVPQLLTSFVAAIIFMIPGLGESVGIILRLGGITSLVACYLSLKLWK
ncbi:MFS general substrate transporter [Neoconidiobolus thromboides FSU 785]|nr:MFS general substrate transporter [Neoconidiobolus thromboides FSU 785]